MTSQYLENCDTLQQNVKNTWGVIGIKWLDNLPSILEYLTDLWQLTDLEPVNNMTYNYVAYVQQDNTPVVLKFSCDEALIVNEYKALKHFDRQAAVKVLAMLLED